MKNKSFRNSIGPFNIHYRIICVNKTLTFYVIKWRNINLFILATVPMGMREKVATSIRYALFARWSL